MFVCGTDRAYFPVWLGSHLSTFYIARAPLIHLLLCPFLKTIQWLQMSDLIVTYFIVLSYLFTRVCVCVCTHMLCMGGYMPEEGVKCPPLPFCPFF